jgi:MFS family permease
MTSGEPLRPLWHRRDYVGWWIGDTISSLGTAVATVAYPLLMLLETGSAVNAGIVGAAGSLGLLATLLIGGALADRVSRRALLLAGPLLQALAVSTVVGAVLLHRVSVAHIAAVGLLQGVIGGLTSGASRPALRRVVPPVQLPAAFSQLQARHMAVRLIGPSVGGLLFSVARWVPFAADAASFVASAAGVALIRTPLGPDTDDRAPRASIFRDIAAGLRFIRGSSYLRFLAVWTALMNASAAGLLLLITVLITDRGGGPATVGAMHSLGAAGGLAGAMVSGAIVKRMPGRTTMLTIGWITAGVFASVAFVPQPWQIGALFAALLFLVAPLNVIFETYELRMIPDELTGRVSTAIDFCAGSLRWLGPLAVGFVASRWAPLAAAIGLAAIVAALALSSHLVQGLRVLDRPIDEVAPTG